MAGYFIAAIKELASNNTDVLVIHWPVKPEAPFNFKTVEGVRFIEKKTDNLTKIKSEVESFGPNIIVTSGWMDKDYLKITKKYYSKIPTVVALDNHWFGTLKQRVLVTISKFWLKKIFSHAWVAGAPQAEYAQKLGFKSDVILKGYYTADVPFYEQQYFDNIKSKKEKFPHVFLYVGRYIEHKGIFDMWEAFIKSEDNNPSDWELWCVGTGEMFEDRVEHKSIKHLGFLQPEEMADIIPKTGVLVLPSHFEPWGVVVHEFAAAGYPLLLSDEIGAGSFFLEMGKNGLSFPSKNPKILSDTFDVIKSLSDKELIALGDESHKRAQLLTPKVWSERLLRLIN